MSTPRASLLERHGRLMARARWIVIPLFIALIQTHFSNGHETTDVQPVFRNATLTVDDSALSLPLSEQQTVDRIDDIWAATGTPDGLAPILVGGEAAVTHDAGPGADEDLARAEMIVPPAARLHRRGPASRPGGPAVLAFLGSG